MKREADGLLPLHPLQLRGEWSLQRRYVLDALFADPIGYPHCARFQRAGIDNSWR